MKKYIVLGLLMLGMLAPVSIFAQSQTDVDPNPNTASCVALNNNLRYQSRDVTTNGEVSTLQDFLQSKGYLNSEPTGYFGLLTLSAVKSFQVANGIEGTGYVGPITRARINAMTCSGVDATPANPNPCPKGAMYSSENGKPCETTTTTLPNPCPKGAMYSSENGRPCGQIPTYPPGCRSNSGYSFTTGLSCGENFGSVTVYLTANEKSVASVKSGGKVTLEWGSTNAAYCSGPDNYPKYRNGGISPSGSLVVYPTGTTVYEMWCYKKIPTSSELKMPDASALVTVKVENDNPISTCSNSGYDTQTGFRCGCTSTSGWSSTTGQDCRIKFPVINLKANGLGRDAGMINIDQGTPVNLSWVGYDVTTCSLYDQVSQLGQTYSYNTQNSSGSYQANNLGGTFTFTIKCDSAVEKNAVGDTIQVYINPATSTCSNSGYDTRTGFRCGCTSTSGFSSTNGESCGTNEETSNTNKAFDNLIKYFMGNARAQAELYYDSKQSYAGVCTNDGGFSEVVPDIAAKFPIRQYVGDNSISFNYNATGINSAVCHDSSSAWAAIISLKQPSLYRAGWCVDSTGASKESNYLFANSTVCP